MQLGVCSGNLSVLLFPLLHVSSSETELVLSHRKNHLYQIIVEILLTSYLVRDICGKNIYIKEKWFCNDLFALVKCGSAWICLSAR